ncbi:FkbM family methyltransferase [Roseibium aggregatum]|uniref:FkbM family methyltransferase n=1 Tax=Roseibium aggregatum TaxID=187304 RepID=UPI003A97A318
MNTKKSAWNKVQNAIGLSEANAADLNDERFLYLKTRIAKLEKSFRFARIPESDIGINEMLKSVLPLMAPKDPVGMEFERVGRSYDGGYVMVKHDAKDRIAYSLGINRDVSWDLDIANRGYDIFQYDHTIDKLPQDHIGFHWKKLGITAANQRTKELSSLDEQMRQNGHEDCTDMLLKLDIEGHEWSVFAELPSETLSKFTQIAVECHGFDRIQKLPWFRTTKEALENLYKTHQVVHIHGNNNSQLRVLGGFPMPKTFELTLLRRDICDFTACSRVFPTELDQPNNPNFADHFLGNFNYF